MTTGPSQHSLGSRSAPVPLRRQLGVRQVKQNPKPTNERFLRDYRKLDHSAAAAAAAAGYNADGGAFYVSACWLMVGYNDRDDDRFSVG